MELTAALRLLWRRRRAVAIGFVVAGALAFMLGRSTTPADGLAKTRVRLDTPKSEIVASNPSGLDTLYWRATLMAMLLGSDSARAQLAHQLNVPVGKIAVRDLELTAPSAPASLPTAAVQAATTANAPYLLTVETDDVLPIVTITATAPTPSAATRLAQAAVRTLQSGSSPTDTATVQGLNIQQIGQIVAREVPAPGGKKKVVVMALVIFSIWCVCLMVGPAVAQISRQRRMGDASAARNGAAVG